MRKQQSLKAKITILVALPLCLFIIMAGLRVNANLETMRGTTRADNNLKFLKALSQVVHESQKERGMSMGYLNGTGQISELEGQRKTVDGKLSDMKAASKNAELDANTRANVEKSIQAIQSVRNDVTAKSITGPQAVVKYTKILDEFLSTYPVIANVTFLPEIASRLRSVASLELAKESAGNVRAALFGVLAKNEPMSEETMAHLLDVKGRVDASLDSPAMVLTHEEQESIRAFEASNEWVSVNKIYLDAVDKSNVGKYNQNPKAFFDTISQSMNRLADIVNQQFAETQRMSDAAYSDAQQALIILSITMLVASFALLTVATMQIRAISRSLENVIVKLTEGAGQVASAAHEIAASGTELSQSVTEQSAAIQETAASVDEIQAMVEKNRDASTRSKETSTNSTRTSQSGKQSVDKMIQAIGQISQSNDEIARQMEAGNREIEEIVKVIAEIGNKTKVINDIVFQTKLLSFNASVEAARAGEHGKGFAVVAEEVGNLAQMSGNASKEISAMLESSIGKVEQIVQNTRSRMGDLVTQSKDKVEQGNAVAAECGKVLDQILSDVSSVDSLVSDIAVASKEQAQGISEVTKAMGQLDQATQQNSAVAQQAASAGEALSSQSNDLNNVVGELRQLVSGGVVIAATQAPTVAKKKERNVIQMPKPAAKAKSTRATHGVAAVANGIPANDDPHFEDF